jgi:hypothetical protein
MTELLETIQLVDSLLRENHIIVAGRHCEKVHLGLRTDGKHLYNSIGLLPLDWIYDITDGKLLYGKLQ